MLFLTVIFIMEGQLGNLLRFADKNPECLQLKCRFQWELAQSTISSVLKQFSFEYQNHAKTPSNFLCVVK